jgi:ribosome-associated protein
MESSGGYDRRGLEPEEEPVQEALTVAREAADALVDKKAIDVVILDVERLLTITDYFVIATGTSRIHAQSLVGAVEEALAADGRKPLRREGRAEGEWVLLDYGDFVVHVFQQAARDFYGLERLWGDAERIEVEDVSLES